MYKAVIDVMSKMNPFVCLAVAVVLMLVVIFRRIDRFGIPRSLALVCWYILVIFSLAWIVFHAVDMFSQGDYLGGVTSVVLLISYSPVYICAIVAAFMYPKSRRSKVVVAGQ